MQTNWARSVVVAAIGLMIALPQGGVAQQVSGQVSGTTTQSGTPATQSKNSAATAGTQGVVRHRHRRRRRRVSSPQPAQPLNPMTDAQVEARQKQEDDKLLQRQKAESQRMQQENDDLVQTSVKATEEMQNSSRIQDSPPAPPWAQPEQPAAAQPSQLQQAQPQATPPQL
jgi:hypothetical protein